MTRLFFAAICAGLLATDGGAQPLFKSEELLTVTLTTNLRDLMRVRDSTRLEWFDAEMRWSEGAGEERTMPVRLRLRGHFRRQASNCSFPPLFIRAAREVREGTILQGNPRVKIVTPCRTNRADFQQYIFTEYLAYRTYQLIDDMHHRTRLAKITYVDSSGREDPIEVYAFFLETASEVADNYDVEEMDRTGVTWDFIPSQPLDRMSLFQYWVGNTDWSVAGLHNVAMFRTSAIEYRPVAYDFDWTGLVNARYAWPNKMLGLTSVKQRLHRGPCRTAEQWAPTIAFYQSQRATIDSLWSTPLPGQDPKRLAEAKKYLDDLWPVLEDPRRFKREIIDNCQPVGN